MKGQGGKKNRKIGRNKDKLAAYSRDRRYEKNKKRRLKKHLRNHSNDRQAVHCFNNILVNI